MESLRHATYRAATLLAARTLPATRAARRFTFRDAHALRPLTALPSIQHRFYSEGLAQEGRPRDDYNPALGQGRQSSAQKSTDDKPTAQLYVGNLFFDVTPGQLRQHFASFGDIEKTRIVAGPEGHSKGYGFVLFKNVEDAIKAREAMNLSVFAGRRILCHFARDNRAEPIRQPKEPTSTLFIGNLHYDLSDTELNELFRPLKNIRDVRVSIDRRTGQPRGFAHADFLSVESAKAAYEQLNGKELKGRVLRCDYGFGARKKPFDKEQKQPKTDEKKLDTRSEGSQQPPENLEDQPEKDQEKEFEQPEDHPEEQLKEEVEKTPEDQAEDKSKQ